MSLLLSQKVIKETIQELLEAGIIEPSTGPWSVPVVVVFKEGKSPRLCCDYRPLNKITKKNAYPIQRIDNILDHLGPSKFFTTLDAKSGYHQIPVHPDDQDKTTFTTFFGTYKWTGMPFGICNAPSKYQEEMDKLFWDILWTFVLNYIDDTVVYSVTFEDHLKHLEEVFRQFRSINIKLHYKKCFFGFDHVDLLGHHISAEGTSTQPATIERILSYPTPTTVKGVQSFLGLAGWYRNFVRDYSKISKPLNRLTRKENPFEWTPECEEAFQKLKTMLSSPPILARPNFNKGFILHTDASTVGLGAILAQKDEKGKERVIYYASKGLIPAEENYTATELELLAVVWAIKKFHHYLEGMHFDLYTDYSALRGLLKTASLKDYSGRINRWVLTLQGMHYTIHHRPGRQHQHVDALSRLGY